jgi:hypothetical protein
MASADTSEDAPAPPIDDARAELQGAVPEAAATIRELLDAEDERIQLRAAEAILDRAGLSKATAPTAARVQKEVGGEPSESLFPTDDADPLEHLL